MFLQTALVCLLATAASAKKSFCSKKPLAKINGGTVIGASSSGVDTFLGIPYANPPVGSQRLKPPTPYNTTFGVFNATNPPNACPQFYNPNGMTGNYSAGALQPLIQAFVVPTVPESEDCLTVNVYRPSNISSNGSLPVMFWMYGGGFEFGSTSMYNGSLLVAKSISLGAPIILVEVNYRLGGFGFMAGQDLAEEGSTNLGMRDQRLAMEWVADNVASFGGDPSKVTVWGESAGAISACFQTTVNYGNNTYKGQPLFRATIQNSGSFAPADNVTAPQAQAIYDQVVCAAGCDSDTAAERLSCLRSLDLATLRNATNSVPVFGGYRSADLSYTPRPDAGDDFYPISAEYAVAAGNWTQTPFIIGDQEDEGTILAIVQTNITTNDDLVSYVASWFPNNPTAVADIQSLAAFYPDDPAGGQPAGSPYNTGANNNIYPQYKRLAAILGDIVFTLTRRAFLTFATGPAVKRYSYLSSYLTTLPVFGTLHASDLAYLFDSGFASSLPTVAIQTYYISFVNYLDPNVLNSTETALNWPEWTTDSPQLMHFASGNLSLTPDTFRSDAYNYIVSKVQYFRV